MPQTAEMTERHAPSQQAVGTINIVKHRSIDAPIALVWEAMLEEITEGMDRMGDKPMNLKLEPWVGGRYFRDLGEGAGHLWGHVQVIKPPGLLEIVGPMFMSYAVASHVQYRLSPDGDDKTELTLTHRAIGMIDPEHAKGVNQGWEKIADKIAEAAARRAKKNR